MGDSIVKNAVRSARSCSVVMLDIDQFKSVNDRYGHAIGDEVIKVIAAVLKDTVREGELSSRLGGEEFAVLLPEGNITHAEALAERIRTRIENASVLASGCDLHFTISLGVAELADNCTTLSAMLGRLMLLFTPPKTAAEIELRVHHRSQEKTWQQCQT